MARYIRDPQLREYQIKLRAEVDRIACLAAGRGHVIYVIRDPTIRDRRGHPDGPPIYVGESKQIRIRTNDHLEDGGRHTTADRKYKPGRLRRIMEKFVVPSFQIVDDAPTYLTALIAETVWARRYRYLGYDLANQWPEHRSKEAPEGLATIPPKRMLDLTVEEALIDEVGLDLCCLNCGIHDRINLETLRPRDKLGVIRKLRIQCSSCSGHFSIRAMSPAPDTWKWASYQARPMTPDC